MLTANIMKHMSPRLFGLVFFLLLGCADGFFNNCAAIYPDSIKSIPVELGKNFTAVCILDKDSKYSADDITWLFGNVSVPRESYTKINNSAIAVTVNVSRDMSNPLKCKASKQTLTYEDPCIYGIYLDKGYPPMKPKDLKCIANQVGKSISPNLSCSWDPGKRDPIIRTNYSLHLGFCDLTDNVTIYKTSRSHFTVNLGTFPNHMMLMVWVEAQNELGAVKSESHRNQCVDSEHFVKPSPPGNVRIIPEDGFPRSLMVNWTHPIHATVFKLKYHIRYCQAGCSVWQEVPPNLTRAYIESFRLQSLQPYTHYVVQMRCMNENDLGYWSDWSPNSTACTPEATPESKPDLWRVYEEASNNAVKLIWKDPEKSNGRILGYDVTIKEAQRSERRFISSKEHKFSLKGEKALIKITANNSVGVSPATTLMIPRPGINLHAGVESMNCSVHDGQLWVNWLPPSNGHPSEYVIEWVSVPQKEINWKRVSNHASNVSFKELKPFKRYNISVYPIYRERNIYQPGTQVTMQAYLQQGPPLRGPTVTVAATGKTSAQLKWDEIAIDYQQGFLINHTIFYKTGSNEQSLVVPSNTYSYKLTGLASDSHYVVYVMVSNQEGSKKGSYSSFNTKEYDDGEIDVIVVVVCLSFLFCVLFIMFFIIKKRASLKRHFWPQVPDPSHSTIANWSPDCPNKPDTPKESLLAEVSVVEVDIDDGKSLCDDEKAVMPFKKYFSEERSSGIGGSSGMSTPRQSVSSNDEADSGQTTASTVQYSAVVSSGYKGQTPGTQAAMFSRSESTQPLLECEENSEHLPEASSHPTNSYFKRRRGLEQLHMDEGEEHSFGSLSFSPMEEEDSPTLTEDPPGPAPSYMPQQSGYRPQ